VQFDKKLRLIKVSDQKLKHLDTEEPRFMDKMRFYQRLVRDLDRRPPWEKQSEKPPEKTDV